MKKIILLLVFPFLAFGQTQIGQDILGESNDAIGVQSTLDFSTDGTTFIIGAPSNDVVGNNAGNARIFKNINNEWTQIGATLTGDLERENFGSNVSISADGTIVVVGAHGDSTITLTLPYIKVFKLVAGQWVQLGNTIGGNASEEFAGFFHGLSEDGSRLTMLSNDIVRVYELVADVWTQIGNSIENDVENSSFRHDIAISDDGNTIAINLRTLVGFNQNENFYSFEVMVYRNISGVWTKIGESIEGEEDNDNFGSSIDFSSNGNTIVIGAFNNSINAFASGQVKIFEFTGNTWMQKGESINGLEYGERVGRCVSISNFGNVIAIGSYKDTSNGERSGDVRIFQYFEESWTQMGNAILGDAAFDFLGGSISLSGNGTKVAIGANGYDFNGINTGLVRVFDLSQILGTNYTVLEQNIVLYPNPASQIIQIKLPADTMIEEIKVYDYSGKLVAIQKSSTVNISALTTGVYVVRISTNKGVATKKIIVD